MALGGTDESYLSGLYECNEKCGCSRSNCHNRVVQQQMKIPLEVIFSVLQASISYSLLAFFTVYLASVLIFIAHVNFLELFKTEKMGWGVRSMIDIPAGVFVCTYAGAILTDSQAEKEGKEVSLFYQNFHF